MDKFELSFVVGIILGREDVDGVRVAYSAYIDALSKWFPDPQLMINELITHGKARLSESGRGRSVLLIDRETIDRVYLVLRPREYVDPLSVVTNCIGKLRNPLTGYADLGSLINCVAEVLGTNTREAEDIVTRAYRSAPQRFVLAHGGSRRMRVGSSYYGLIKVA